MTAVAKAVNELERLGTVAIQTGGPKSGPKATLS